MASLEQDSSSLTEQDQGESLEQANEEQSSEDRASVEQSDDEQANDEQANDEQANDEQANDEQANDEQVNDTQASEERASDEPDDEQTSDDQESAADNQPDPVHDDDQMDDEHMNAMIEQLCNSKADEFKLIGYEHVSGQDVWECVSDKYHKHGTPPLYQVVNDILSLKVTQFMNYITLNMYRGDQRG